jgi:hypothetical protein
MRRIYLVNLVKIITVYGVTLYSLVNFTEVLRCLNLQGRRECQPSNQQDAKLAGDGGVHYAASYPRKQSF